MQERSCDILIIGAGLAGLSLALHCADELPQRKIILLAKASLIDNNSYLAQGGVAAVMDQVGDSYDDHLRDTLQAGDGLCDRRMVDLIVRQAPKAIKALEYWGVRFDRHQGKLALGREGGHSAPRIVHHQDQTGKSIVQQLVARCQEKANIELREQQFVLDLLGNASHCQGAIVKGEPLPYRLRAHYTVLATGGAGQAYALSSNPAVATGDGIAMARRLGAQLSNMAFVQFHPTVLFEPGASRPFLISEALRGHGALLRDHEGQEFMYRYDSRGSLATRDVVSRAIFAELQSSGQDHLWLDLSHLNSSELQQHFPAIVEKISSLGIDYREEMVPILPAAHYFCGGISTDDHGRSSVDRLLALGECACTGLHGANRLASNSLLEAVVMAQRAAQWLSENFREYAYTGEPGLTVANFPLDSEDSVSNIRRQVQSIMSSAVGIVRTRQGLQEAKAALEEKHQQLEASVYSVSARETLNLITVAKAVLEDSLRLKQNRGAFYREDLSLERAPMA